MGRPKKDGRMVNCYLNAEICKNLDLYCLMTGMTKTSVIEKALAQFLGPYEMESDTPLKAVYLSGGSEYERMVAKNEGRELVIKEEPCFVLGKTTMMGEPYYRILKDNQLMKVPENVIKFIGS